MSVVIDGVAQPMQRMDYNAFVYSSSVELGFPLQLNLTGSSGRTFTETFGLTGRLPDHGAPVQPLRPPVRARLQP